MREGPHVRMICCYQDLVVSHVNSNFERTKLGLSNRLHVVLKLFFLASRRF